MNLYELNSETSVSQLVGMAISENWKELDLSSKGIKRLPREISNCHAIEKLYLDNNGLIEFPEEICGLRNLKEVYLCNNKISAITKNIRKLSNLEILSFGSKFSSIDNCYTQRIVSLPWEISKLSNLKKLDVSNTAIFELPRFILALKNIESLIISNTNIYKLPLWISDLNIAELRMASTGFAYLPMEIFNLKKLQILDISNLGIRILTSKIGELINLSYLNLSQNYLKNLPPEISKLVNLSELSLDFNSIIDLPRELSKLTNLKILKLKNNHLDELIPEIGKLNNLQSLDVSSNQLQELPTDIIQIRQLKNLNLQRNNLPIPPEILAKDNNPPSILNYYFETLKQQKQPLNEMKVLIVGQGSVGKTSLASRILHNDFNLGESKTDGIAISQWFIDNLQISDDKLRLNIWDFGGQEIMHATHQFFLTKRSLYLLVLDARLTQEENRTEYWLKLIQSFGGASPVLIVGNKIDQHPLDIDRTGLQKKYPNIVGIVETSAATGKGINKLKTAIISNIYNLDHVNDLFPKTWFDVKTHIENVKRNKNFITYDKYLSLCKKNNVLGETSQRTLISFLHDLGIVLHFQDDPRLESLGILNPQWVTNGVYKILNSHSLFLNQGMLKIQMLDEILNSPEYPRSKRFFIIDLMRKFELCYDIESNKSFLVPDLLSKDEPFTGSWDDSLEFQYHYNVLPSSIITRFIVRMNALIYKTVWRSGVVLNNNGNTALVKADYEDRIIYVSVSGNKPTRRDFLSVIRAELKVIHKTIANISVEEKIPHPEHPEVVFDYQELLRFERDGISEFPKSIKGRSSLVRVHRLLDGISIRSERQMDLVNKEYSELEQSFSEQNPNEKSRMYRFIHFIFSRFPLLVGRTILDVFGREKAADSSAKIIGYLVIIVLVLLIWGYVDANIIIDIFSEIWRFFFPLKN